MDRISIFMGFFFSFLFIFTSNIMDISFDSFDFYDVTWAHIDNPMKRFYWSSGNKGFDDDNYYDDNEAKVM